MGYAFTNTTPEELERIATQFQGLQDALDAAAGDLPEAKAVLIAEASLREAQARVLAARDARRQAVEHLPEYAALERARAALVNTYRMYADDSWDDDE
jgi:hypothetical protein